ncbi:MAG: ZIP family metal transporter [Eubacteriales bacterium]|nr:ZIP family metal transporter [Eubacteriales bacterium]MDD3349264.1 ZIP family metal transporter [Eubacteriales bacterium]
MATTIIYVLLGTGCTFLATVLGAALVFLFKGEVKPSLQRVFLGFAAGIMIAASIFSLLLPAMELAKEQGLPVYLPSCGGFACGVLFLLLLDHLLPHLHPGSKEAEGLPSKLKRTTMLVLAVTLHNIPEGMAVGLAFALASLDQSKATLSAAIILAIGMSLQNFPEGAAISLPLKKEGFSNKKAFFYGALSGLVEPLAGVLTILAAGNILAAMPWILSFSAGAMLYVVVEELIPEAHLGEHSNLGTMSVMTGFLLMMFLDVALS